MHHYEFQKHIKIGYGANNNQGATKKTVPFSLQISKARKFILIFVEFLSNKGVYNYLV